MFIGYLNYLENDKKKQQNLYFIKSETSTYITHIAIRSLGILNIGKFKCYN